METIRNNKAAETILEFNKIKEIWKGYAMTDGAKEAIEGAAPILSSLLVSAGSTACFVILGAFMTVVGIGICLSVKSAWLLSLQEKKNGN